MTDRFDFEQQIMRCWSVTDELDILFEGIVERDLTLDQISNIVLGMRELYNLKFDTLFNQFEQLVKEGKIK